MVGLITVPVPVSAPNSPGPDLYPVPTDSE